jgi:hypothetical protein
MLARNVWLTSTNFCHCTEALEGFSKSWDDFFVALLIVTGLINTDPWQGPAGSAVDCALCSVAPW